MAIECYAPCMGDGSYYTLSYIWHDSADNIHTNTITCPCNTTADCAQAVFVIHQQSSIGGTLTVTKVGSTGYVNVMVDEKILYNG